MKLFSNLTLLNFVRFAQAHLLKPVQITNCGLVGSPFLLCASTLRSLVSTTPLPRMDTPGQACVLHHRGHSHPSHPHQTHLRTDSINPDKALETVFSLKLATAIYDPCTEGTRPPDLVVTAAEPHAGDSSTAVPAAPRQPPPLLSKTEGKQMDAT